MSYSRYDLSRRKNTINYKFPLKIGQAGAFQMSDDVHEAVASNIKLLLLTNWGERPMHPTFGANLRQFLFEPEANAIASIEDRIVDALTEWMPFVQVKTLEVATNNTDLSIAPNTIKISLVFSISSIQDAEKALELTVGAS